MSATRSFAAAQAATRPDVWDRFINDPNRWELSVRRPDDGKWEVMPSDTDFRIVSEKHGSVESAVVVHQDDGTPNFDRPLVCESRNVNTVVFGIKDGVTRIGMIRQPRPHADDPRNPESTAPVVFLQVPMGFTADKITGETSEEAARREAGEEAGAPVVKRCFQPEWGKHNPNPTFVSSWSDLWFVEVDLDRLEELRPDRNEPIYSVHFLTALELLEIIRKGEDEAGAVARGCTSLSVLMIFFATFPECFTA